MNVKVYAINFQKIDKTMLALVGGKGANLGELSRIKGVQVPDGFCVTTAAYKEILEQTPELPDLLEQLAHLTLEDNKAISETSAKIRQAIRRTIIPEAITEAVTRHVAELGDTEAYAVRSSATAEDLPTASFAGQQDTYLNIVGIESIVEHMSKCWASLFTDRAVIYRLQNGFDHRDVQLSVVIQKMVFPDVAGIVFTADPVSADRKVVSIDASFGLGDAMVSGLVNADVYKVHDGEIISKRISLKKLAVYAIKDGGTKEQEVESERQAAQALTDAQIVQLERMGRTIEEHFGCPQDIEWCLVVDTFYIVQSRPITTLYPVPEAGDKKNHVYVSVGHQQMMTDAMKPLGLSLWQLTAFRPMFKAGGRLFVDVTDSLATTIGRTTLLGAMRQHDPLIEDALKSIAEQNYIQLLPDDATRLNRVKSSVGKSSADIQAQIKNDPAVVSKLIQRSEASIKVLKQDIQYKSGPELFDFILEDGQQSRKSLFDQQNMNAIMASIDASTWINKNMKQWLNEKSLADTLCQSAPYNITSEMGLELLDIADVIRPYPEVIEYLKQAKDDTFWDELLTIVGGQEVCDALRIYLNKYGMRCAGEIDITNTRWSEKPTILVPMIINNIKNFKPNASKRKFEQGRQEASTKEAELLGRLRQLPDGEQKVQETQQMISLLRDFAGYREYPKYSIVSRSFVYKQALLIEAERLVQAKVIHEKEDVYYLTFEELREVVRTHKLDYQIIGKRRAEHKIFEKLTPPRVITSDGEVIVGKYERENLPAEAIVGLAVSSGVVEGRARVCLNMEDANLEAGDILVTTFTDPSWTPLFVSIYGLVTEVGGLMTHGAVIAREYGLPAVVGVENATKLIKDGQQIRVNGTEGYIEILPVLQRS